jgi:hypothetical protein
MGFAGEESIHLEPVPSRIESGTGFSGSWSSPQLQEVAWTRHDFRGPLGTTTGKVDKSVERLLPAADVGS